MSLTLEKYLAAFGDAVQKNKDGSPQLLYRGEHGANPEGKIIESRLGSISFCTLDVAKVYAESPNSRNDTVVVPRILSGYLIINNPVINSPDDPFIDMVILERSIGYECTKKIALKYNQAISNTNNWETLSQETECDDVADFISAYPERLNELYCDAYYIMDDVEIIARLRDIGFDGAIHAGNSVSAEVPEFKIFDSFQFIPENEFENHLTPENISSIIIAKMKPDILSAISSINLQGKKPSVKSILDVLGNDYFQENFGSTNQLVAILGEKFKWGSGDYNSFYQKILKDIFMLIQRDRNHQDDIHEYMENKNFEDSFSIVAI